MEGRVIRITVPVTTLEEAMAAYCQGLGIPPELVGAYTRVAIEKSQFDGVVAKWPSSAVSGGGAYYSPEHAKRVKAIRTAMEENPRGREALALGLCEEEAIPVPKVISGYVEKPFSGARGGKLRVSKVNLAYTLPSSDPEIDCRRRRVLRDIGLAIKEQVEEQISKGKQAG